MLETTCFNVQVRCASARRTLHLRKGALGIVTCEKSLSLCHFLPLTCPQLMVEHWLHTSATRWKASLPWHATSVRASHPKTSCVTSSATPAPCDSKKNSVHLFPLSSDICTGTFCVLPSQSRRRVHSAFVAVGSLCSSIMHGSH